MRSITTDPIFTQQVKTKRFYVTLVQEVQGFCIVAYAPDEITLRRYLNTSYGRLWCGVYEEKPEEVIIGRPLYLYK